MATAFSGKELGGVAFEAPADGALFPADMAPPVFRWRAANPAADTWLVLFRFADGGTLRASTADASEWRPPKTLWRRVKGKSTERPATVTVVGVRRDRLSVPQCSASLSFQVSKDPVGAPIFFRDVNLPFADAVKDPSKIRWRLGDVGSVKPPPVVLENLPVCGNCHSFSRDGKVMGMDVDYANDKGSYVTSEIAPTIDLTPDKIFSWGAYRREDGRQTFGLLSQVSPDGRYVVSTVKDRSVFLPMPQIEFSQLFFPIQGILAVYDRQTGSFQALPGADDPEFVQSNPSWSPDGQTIVFARQRAHHLKNPVRTDAVLLRIDECSEFLNEGLPFQYDLYRIPFNGGRGGTPKPLAGASRNGKSNYFPKFSPDGRWIVFCQASNYMLLRADSELFIVPAEGGEARRLVCNLPRMNSWHSWSPNGRWLVFSSKTGSPFTRLFLTHIDARGDSTPAVLLDAFAIEGRAANIPEFVNIPEGGIRAIRERFVNDTYLVRSGNAFRDGGAFHDALEQYRRALERNPDNAEALMNLGATLSDLDKLPEAADTLTKALRLSPGHAVALYNLAIVHAKRGDFDEAIRCCGESVRIDPSSANAQCNLGLFLLERDRPDEAFSHLCEAIRLDPKKDNAFFAAGRIFVRRGRLADAVRSYAEALRLAPDDERYLNALAWLHATAPDPSLRDGKRAVELASRLCEKSHFQSPRALDILGASYAEAGRFAEAIRAATMAVEGAQKTGNQRLAAEAARHADCYRRGQPFHQ